MGPGWLSSPFHGEGTREAGEGRRVSGVVVNAKLYRFPALRAGPFDPSFAKAAEGPLPHEVGKKESVALSPDLFRGLAAFQMQAQPDLGTRPGEVGRDGKGETPELTRPP